MDEQSDTRTVKTNKPADVLGYKKPFHVAVINGDMEAIVALEKTCKGINEMENGQTPLHLAIMKGEILTAEKLVDLGASLSKRNVYGYPPLHLAVICNHLLLLDSLIDTNSNEDVDAFDGDGNTALHIAVVMGNMDAIALLLRCGADPDLPNRDGSNALHIALIKGNSEVIDAVLEYVVKPNILTKEEVRPLHLAVFYNQIEAIQKIGRLENLKVNYLDGGGDAALHIAAKLGNSEAVDQLHTLGANMNQKTSKGFSAIHLAVMYGRLNVIETLVQCGTCVDIGDKYRNTPAHLCVQQNNVAALKLLGRLEANFDSKNVFGDSPLHSVITTDYKYALRILLHYEANVNIPNAKGMTPLHIAVCFGDKDIIDILFQYGAGVNSLDSMGNRPLHTAAKFCNLVGIKTVLKYGAKPSWKNRDGVTAMDIILSYVREHTFKTAFKTVTDLYKNWNLKRKVPLGKHEILESAKQILTFEILGNFEHSALNEPVYTSDVIPILKSHINDCFAEVKLMKSTLLHENFSFYSFALSGWVSTMPLTCAYASEVALDHILDISTTKGYPKYRDIIISSLERAALLKKVSYLSIYACYSKKTIFLDLDVVPLIVKELNKEDILNLLLAYSDLNSEAVISESSTCNKRKYRDSKFNSVNRKYNLRCSTIRSKEFSELQTSVKKSKSSIASSSKRVNNLIRNKSKNISSSKTTSEIKVHLPEVTSCKRSAKTFKRKCISVNKSLKNKGSVSSPSTKVKKKNYALRNVKTTKEKHSSISARVKKISSKRSIASSILKNRQ